MLETDTKLVQRNFEQLATANRYYSWFTDLVMPHVGKKVLEIGCGQGNITAHFLDRGVEVHGIDLEPSYVAAIKERFKGRKFSVEIADITEAAVRERLKAMRFDTIVCVNVIEHIADDSALARCMHEILVPGGSAILLAPAHEYLMSDFDKVVGHYRRYTKRSLSAAVASGGFSISFATYFNALGALGWLVKYKWLRGSEPGTGAVALQELLVPILKHIEYIVPIPFGLSAIVVGTKSKHA